MCYLIPSFGLSVTSHYCGGKLKSVSLSFSKSHNCCGAKKMKPGCCKDKVCTFKISDTRQSASSSTIVSNQTGFSHYSFYTATPIVVADNRSIQFLSYYNNSPPLGSLQPLYLSNKVFRI
jgi:hypothetical protein